MTDISKSIAELAAMRARGELTAEQFEEAKRLLQQDKAPDVSSRTDIHRAARPAFSEAAKPVKAEKKKGGGGKAFILILAIIVGAYIVGGDGKTGGEKGQAKATQTSQEDAEKRRKGFHCLSGWDGSHRDFVQRVSEGLREPDSFEHVETRITPVVDGNHNLFMKFRAKNGFGGTNLGTATATIHQLDCSLVTWKVVSDS